MASTKQRHPVRGDVLLNETTPQASANPSALYLDMPTNGGDDGGALAAGRAVLGVCMVGNRAVVLEVQVWAVWCYRCPGVSFVPV